MNPSIRQTTSANNASSATNPLLAPASASATEAFAANTARIGWSIQNCGTNVLYVLLGSGTASSTLFHFALKASTGNDDGTGGSVNQTQGAVYTGQINVGGTSPRYVILEMAP